MIRLSLIYTHLGERMIRSSNHRKPFEIPFSFLKSAEKKESFDFPFFHMKVWEKKREKNEKRQPVIPTLLNKQLLGV